MNKERWILLFALVLFQYIVCTARKLTKNKVIELVEVFFIWDFSVSNFSSHPVLLNGFVLRNLCF